MYDFDKVPCFIEMHEIQFRINDLFVYVQSWYILSWTKIEINIFPVYSFSKKKLYI
jgi:hypothetical protein